MKKVVIFLLIAIITTMGCNSTDNGETSGEALSEKISIKGLQDEVRIFYDEFQVPHIYAKNDLDVYTALGYIEARERLFQMEFFRRLSTGRLAELLGDFGGLVVQLDWVMRAMNMTPDGREVWDEMAEQASPEVRAVVDAFVNGVNSYIDQIKNGEKVYYPVEFKYLEITPDLLDHWTARDVYAIDRLLTFFLSTTLDEEFLFSAWYVNLKDRDPALLKELMDLRPVAMTPTLPYFHWNATPPVSGTSNAGDIPVDSINSKPLMSFYNFLQEVARTFHIPFDGWASNDFVVSGKRSATGHAFLANDPHLELLNPPILYEFHLDTKSLPGATGDMNVEGLSFVGVPAVVIGHNEHLAWGGTFLGYDVTDLYAEKISTIAGKDYFLHNGKWYPVVHYSGTIRIRNYPDNTFTEKIVDFPYIKWEDKWHGPLFRLDSIGPTGQFILMTPSNMSGITNVAIKWTGMEPTREAEAYIKINHATTYDEFVSAATLIGVGGQNLVFADDKGNIGYAPFARVPIRQLQPGTEPWHIMDGTVDNEWIGYVPLNELPQVTTPEQRELYNDRGFIATANNEQFGESYDNNPLNEKYYLMSDADIGFREERITDLLEEGVQKGNIDMSYMQKVQTDDYSLVGEYFLNVLRNRYLPAIESKNLPNKQTVKDILDILNKWSYFTPTGTGDPFGKMASPSEITDSVATLIFHAWAKRIVKNTLYDEIDHYGVPRPFNEWGCKILYYLLTATSTTDAPTFDPSLGYSKLFDNINTPETETPQDIIYESLVETVNFLSSSTGSSKPLMWKWGIFHQSLFIDIFIPYTRGPYPRDGGDFTVNVGKTDSSGTDFTNTHAAVTRFIVELEPGNIHAINSLPGYNSGRYPQMESEDQLPLWLHNEYREMHFYLSDVEKHSREFILLTPQQ